MGNNAISKVARRASFRLANSPYWRQLNLELMSKKTNRAIETVKHLKDQLKEISRRLDHIENLLYKNYYQNLSKLPMKSHEKSHL